MVELLGTRDDEDDGGVVVDVDCPLPVDVLVDDEKYELEVEGLAV